MTDFERIAKVIDYLSVNHRSQPPLRELAELVNLSPYHFQRLFVRWAGVTPKKFIQCLTVQAVKQRLRNGRTVMDAAWDAGLSGPGRLHDLTVALEAASPGEIKSGGAGWIIEAGFASSPFGECLIAASPRGICRLAFVNEPDRTAAEAMVAADWPEAAIIWNNQVAAKTAATVFSASVPRGGKRDIRCFVRGTQFQVQVWRALLRIPSGELTTYGHIARVIGNPNAYRAIGSAIGRNPLGYLIPCHRVIRETGVVGDYRWGQTRKRAVIAHELATENGPNRTEAEA